MKRWQAVAEVIQQAGEAIVVHANGMICRESFALADRQENFYMLGSMGLAASIGLGISIGQPTRRVIVLDGDGNVLMNLGEMAMIGALQPRNLLHVVLDNGSYESTGGQPTINRSIALERVARSLGYRMTERVRDMSEVGPAIQRASHGPGFILVEVEAGRLATCQRIPLSAELISRRVRDLLCRT